MTVLRGGLLAWSAKWSCIYRRNYSSKTVRNIGILAHIDAGKTTTTERMLFYAGKTRALGEVHRGNTVTDYLTQERERGITICSSAVTFPWRDMRINLLDTPGHIDFTMEVEQSLHAVDGVVIVLDGTAGVEAQTVTVWSQAERHNLPKLVFVNKMDRPDADFEQSVNDVRFKLDAKPVCLQLPEKDSKGVLSILDILRLEKCVWNAESLGRKYTKEALNIDEHPNVLAKRHELIDLISGVDDELAEVVIANEGFDKISNELLAAAIRRATCQQKIVPILLGSAYKNVGIQLLMDDVINYLPAPHERNQLYNCFENDFVGKVFKIVHDKQRGPLTLVRVLRGDLKKGMRLLTTRGNVTEIVGKLYEPLADEYREIDIVRSGDVGICTGLKNTITGDLVAASASSLKNAQKRLRKLMKIDNVENLETTNDSTDDFETQLISEILATEPKIPDAVYFCSIEPPSIASQNAMENALKQLQREDPSLRVSYDTVTGQTVLGGMGELHMDIIKSRILSEYKINVDLGPLQIAYKETITEAAKHTLHLEKEISGNKQSVIITLELLNDKKDIFILDKSPENTDNLRFLRPRNLQTIRRGAIGALERGPRVGGQVTETQICLHNVTIGRGTADSFLMAAAAQCVQKILTEAGTHLLEPIMAMEIIAPNDRVSKIIADLSRRRAAIQEILPKGVRDKMIIVNAPLAELIGYSSSLRTISSGTASMTMQPCGFAAMNTHDEEIAIRRAQGLE